MHSSQEPVEQVLVLALGPAVVSDLFCCCLRSDLECPPLLFGHLARLSWQNHGMMALVLAGMYTWVRIRQNRSLCLLLALQW